MKLRFNGFPHTGRYLVSDYDASGKLLQEVDLVAGQEAEVGEVTARRLLTNFGAVFEVVGEGGAEGDREEELLKELRRLDAQLAEARDQAARAEGQIADLEKQLAEAKGRTLAAEARASALEAAAKKKTAKKEEKKDGEGEGK